MGQFVLCKLSYWISYRCVSVRNQLRREWLAERGIYSCTVYTNFLTDENHDIGKT
jgi:hypothetical protein